MENNIVNATNEQIELIEDKSANLSMRTKESLKAEFKNVDGATDNDKLVRLLELHRKFQATQDKFSIDTNLDVIDEIVRQGAVKYQYQCEKNFTDSEEAFELGISKNAKRIIFLGATGQFMVILLKLLYFLLYFHHQKQQILLL